MALFGNIKSNSLNDIPFVREENYEDLSNEDNFMCLNKMTHQLIHDGYRYYEKDPEFGERVLKCWEKMYEINHKDKDE